MRSYVVALDSKVAVSDFIASRHPAFTARGIAILGVAVKSFCLKGLVWSKMLFARLANIACETCSCTIMDMYNDLAAL